MFYVYGNRGPSAFLRTAENTAIPGKGGSPGQRQGRQRKLRRNDPHVKGAKDGRSPSGGPCNRISIIRKTNRISLD